MAPAATTETCPVSGRSFQSIMARKSLDMPSFMQTDEEAKGRRRSHHEVSYVLHRRSSYAFPCSQRFALFPQDPLLIFPKLDVTRKDSPYVAEREFTRVDTVRTKDVLIQINESSPFRHTTSPQTLRDNPSTKPSSEGAPSVRFASSHRSQQQISETESESQSGSFQPESVGDMTKALREQIMAVHREYASARRDEWHLHSITPASSVGITYEKESSEELADLYDDSEEDLPVEEGVSRRDMHNSETQASKNVLIHASKPQCDLRQLSPKEPPNNSTMYVSTVLDQPSRASIAIETPVPDSPLTRKIVLCEEHSTARLIESRESRIQVKQVDIVWAWACAGFAFTPKIEFSNVANSTGSRMLYEQENQLLFCKLSSSSILHDLVRKEVKWVSSGFEHVVVVTAEGLVYSWGYGAGGCLGHGDTNSATFPKLVEGLRTKSVLYIECGAYHTAAVTDDGELYSWGRGDVHQLGVSFNSLVKDDLGYSALVPTRVDFFRKKHLRVKAVACGEAHTLVLDSNGQVYAFGWAEDGQLGIPATDLADGQMTHKIREIRALQQTKIVKVSAGTLFSCALTESGQVFVWGNGEQGQLGLGSRVTRLEFPTLQTHLRAECVLDLVCGENYVVCVTHEGKLWGWGQGLAGRFEGKQFVPGTDLACFLPRALKMYEIDQRVLLPRLKARKTTGETGEFSERLAEKLADLQWEGPFPHA